MLLVAGEVWALLESMRRITDMCWEPPEYSICRLLHGVHTSGDARYILTTGSSRFKPSSMVWQRKYINTFWRSASNEWIIAQSSRVLDECGFWMIYAKANDICVAYEDILICMFGFRGFNLWLLCCVWISNQWGARTIEGRSDSQYHPIRNKFEPVNF